MTWNAIRAPFTHHATADPPKPDRAGWWQQHRRTRYCRQTLHHCYHLIPDTWDFWYCCNCAHHTDGMPTHRCTICTHVSAAGSSAGS